MNSTYRKMDYEDCACWCLAPLSAQDGPASDCDWLAIGINSMSSCGASRILLKCISNQFDNE
jgi:hypothetical protein